MQRKHIILLAASIFLLASSYEANASCEDASITEISSDGAAITMDDGSIWEVDSVDRVDSTLWTVGDDVLACDDGYLILKSGGEKVGATQLK